MDVSRDVNALVAQVGCQRFDAAALTAARSETHGQVDDTEAKRWGF